MKLCQWRKIEYDNHSRIELEVKICHLSEKELSYFFEVLKMR